MTDDELIARLRNGFDDDVTLIAAADRIAQLTNETPTPTQIEVAIWRVLEDELERDLHLDLNDTREAKEFERIVTDIRDAVLGLFGLTGKAEQ